MATIKDVARQAGVSIATVSNYLNQTKPVSKEAALRIQAAVDALQYAPNLSAKSLKSNSYMDIGIVLPNFDDPYYVQMFQGIESTFQNTGYFTNLAFSYDIPDFERNITYNFLKKKIKGMILISCQPDSWKFYYDHFTSDQNRPLVLIDRDIHSLDANFGSLDNQSVIRRMTAGLLEQGYRQIFLLSGPQSFECEHKCILGFQEVFLASSLPYDPAFLVKTNLSKEDAFRKTIQLLRNTRPEALITTSETIADGAIEALTLLGFRSDEIPVLTLGEEHWNLYTKSFASVSAPRPAIKLGQTAAGLLLEQLNSPLTKENEKIILPDTCPNYRIPPLPTREKCLTDEPACTKKLRILMVNTPQVHTLQGLLRNFENNTGIKAEVTILPHHYLYETILQKHQAQEEEPYDVFMYDIPWLSALATNHVLADITKEIRDLDLSIFLPDCLKYFSEFNHRYYGIPFMYAPQILYYRKDLFENPELKALYERQNNISLRPPLTLKEFHTVADFFTCPTDAIPYGISIPAAYNECLAPEIYMRLNAYGSGVFDSKGNVCLDRPSSLKAYIHLLRSVRSAKPDFRSADDVSIVQDFLNGNTAMLITYPSFLTDVVDLRKSSMVGSIGYHHIPGKSPLLGGWSLGISSRSSRKQEAFSFLKWICDEQTANYFALLGGQSAITSTYTNDELNKLYPWLPLYLDTYQYTRPTLPPRLKNGVILSQNDIDAIVCKWIYKILDQEIEVQDAITNTHRELEQLTTSLLQSSYPSEKP